MTSIPTDLEEDDNKSKAAADRVADFPATELNQQPPLVPSIISAEGDQSALTQLESTTLPITQADRDPTGAPTAQASNSKKSKTPKVKIETLEGLVAYAYSRKGQQITLRPQVEKVLARGPSLDADARQRLLVLAECDPLLAVPRQLLLIAFQAERSKVKNELRDFVGEILCAHPAFGTASLVAVVKNLPDAPTIDESFELAASIDFPVADTQKRKFKGKEIVQLKTNAVNILAIWFAATREISLADLSRQLFISLWQPRMAQDLGDTGKMRHLTDISEFAGVGVACKVFKEEAERQSALARSAQRGMETGLEQARKLSEEVERLKARLEAQELDIQRLNESLGAQKAKYEVEFTHERARFHQLRGRILRCLSAELSLLEEGLHALRKQPPKVHVMDDHADRVVDALRAEISKLEDSL